MRATVKGGEKRQELLHLPTREDALEAHATIAPLSVEGAGRGAETVIGSRTGVEITEMIEIGDVIVECRIGRGKESGSGIGIGI